MKFVKFFLSCLILFNISIAHASQNLSSFIAKKDGKIIHSQGNIDERYPPFSTFKVTLALMGFDSGILTSKDSPKWSFKKDYEKNFPDWYTPATGIKNKWAEDHTPETFIKKSVLWYSHQITERLGKEKFAEYIGKFNYGNQDVSGTPGKDDGLTMSWLDTSLKISPREQVEFLEKLFANDSIASFDAKEKTREILARDEDWNGWKLYGKTGGGTGNRGWFVGWIEKDDVRIFFAHFIVNANPEKKSMGSLAKDMAKEILLTKVEN